MQGHLSHSPDGRQGLSPETHRANPEEIVGGLQAQVEKPIAGAIRYCLRNWDALCRFTTDGNIPIDNNRTERTLRAQAIGRKNWIFLGSDNGGRTAAVLYSLVASAKRHHVAPWKYVKDLLTQIPARPAGADLTDLLPNVWSLTHPSA